MKFSGVKILQRVEISIFLLIFKWALQQCSATALPVIFFSAQTCSNVLGNRKGRAPDLCCSHSQIRKTCGSLAAGLEAYPLSTIKIIDIWPAVVAVATTIISAVVL